MSKLRKCLAIALTAVGVVVGLAPSAAQAASVSCTRAFEQINAKASTSPKIQSVRLKPGVCYNGPKGSKMWKNYVYGENAWQWHLYPLCSYVTYHEPVGRFPFYIIYQWVGSDGHEGYGCKRRTS